MATRKAIRQAIGLRTGQPFFARFGATNKTATGGSTTTLIDTANLLQNDDYWNGDSLYLLSTVNSGTSRVIHDFVNSTKTITFQEPVTAIQSSDPYEIWSTLLADQVNEAINEALRDAWPWFFTVNEGLIVIQSGVGVSYSLSSLSPAPKRIAQVHLEQISEDLAGTSVAAPGAQNYLKDTSQTFTSEHVGWQARVYDGTSQGDYRTASALVDANTLEMSSNFTTTLDATSKYRLVNTADADLHWTPLRQWNLNSIDSPTILRLASHPTAFEGYLMRVVYEAEHVPMTLDTETTTCNQEWLELAAIARLYLTRLAHAPAAEIRSVAALQNTFAEAAENMARRRKQQHISGTILDWQRRFAPPSDYPF